MLATLATNKKFLKKNTQLLLHNDLRMIFGCGFHCVAKNIDG
jgi:hypothetical protein